MVRRRILYVKRETSSSSSTAPKKVDFVHKAGDFSFSSDYMEGCREMRFASLDENFPIFEFVMRGFPDGKAKMLVFYRSTFGKQLDDRFREFKLVLDRTECETGEGVFETRKEIPEQMPKFVEALKKWIRFPDENIEMINAVALKPKEMCPPLTEEEQEEFEEDDHIRADFYRSKEHNKLTKRILEELGSEKGAKKQKTTDQ